MLLGIGGVVGYVNSGSSMSALAGCGCGLFLTVVGYASYEEYKQTPVASKLWPALSLGTYDYFFPTYGLTSVFLKVCQVY